MQHGFPKGLSCQTNLIYVFDKINYFLDKGSAVDLIYLEFRKVFNLMPPKPIKPMQNGLMKFRKILGNLEGVPKIKKRIIISKSNRKATCSSPPPPPQKKNKQQTKQTNQFMLLEEVKVN